MVGLEELALAQADVGTSKVSPRHIPPHNALSETHRGLESRQPHNVCPTSDVKGPDSSLQDLLHLRRTRKVAQLCKEVAENEGYSSVLKSIADHRGALGVLGTRIGLGLATLHRCQRVVALEEVELLLLYCWTSAKLFYPLSNRITLIQHQCLDSLITAPTMLPVTAN
jgi:hypothetical protein